MGRSLKTQIISLIIKKAMKNFNIAILRPKFSQVFFLFQGCDRENGVEPAQKKTPFFGQEASADFSKKTISRTD